MEKQLIKFRAWNRKNKKMAYDITIPLLAREKENVLAYPTDAYDWLQYTGLKDKNGKEIYEGDILIIINGLKRAAVKYEVDCGGFIAQWEYSKNQHHVLLTCDEAIESEVIGNIFETPSLSTGI